MEEEKKKMSKETKKFLIIISSFIAVIIISIIVCVIIMNKSNNKIIDSSNDKSLTNKSLTTEDIITVLEQDGRTEYLQKDSIKIGAIINYDYDKYNQIACYSCIYKSTKTLKYGCLMLINNYTGEYKNIVTDTYISALIFSQISSNNTNAQEEIMKLICNYFNENGLDNFNYGNKDNFDRYANLGEEIGKVIGIKECRTLIDNAIHNDNTELEKFAFFYKPKEIFPRYAGCETTDKKYVWDKYGIAEYAINSLGTSTYNAMVYSYGYPYQYITKYTVMEYMGKESTVVGEYSNKENAKEKLVLEEATDDPSTNTNTSTTTNSTVIEDIQDRIDFFNSYYAWNFHPTNEQMQQMVEFANSTSNFTNDTLADFIIDKGWLPDSGTGTVSSNNSSSTTTNNGNSGSSNKNTSSSSNDDDNTSREVIATVNINLKELIAKNTVATEIKNESERIDIRVYVEDAFVKDDYFEYFSGGASVPNTITTTVKVYENEKKLNDKRKVIITMDNTRTLIKETTLYDGEMIFNKTGTYEIK